MVQVHKKIEFLRACKHACVCVCSVVRVLFNHLYSDAVTELSQEIVLFGSEMLNSLWVTLAEQLRVSGTLVKEVSYLFVKVGICFRYICSSDFAHRAQGFCVYVCKGTLSDRSC